jgi:hypothetical protein
VLHASKSSDGGAIKKAYNDNALFNFHMMTQAQKIRDYSAMDTFVDTQSLWNLAWHDSFVRNGLSDFVPPMTGELNVLVVGGQNQQLINGETNVLAGDEDKIDISNNNLDSNVSEGGTNASKVEALKYQPSSLQHVQRDSSCSFLASIFDENSDIKSSSRESNTALESVMYDCIMDEGLIADLVRTSTDTGISNKNKQDVARLLLEATKRIREIGIYVANTQPMSTETKEYLEMLGEMLGLQWEFDLDGLSDEKTSVNVARKFGTCPTIGWQTMARLLDE